MCPLCWSRTTDSTILFGKTDGKCAVHSWSHTVLRIVGNLEVQAMANDSRPRLNPRISVLSCPPQKQHKKLHSSFLHQVDEKVNICTEMPLMWCARTCKVACISLLPLGGSWMGSCAGPVRRKPTTTVSVHTARRCCLLRPLIILRLLSEEKPHQDSRAPVIHSCSLAGRPGFICLSGDKRTLGTTMQVSADNRLELDDQITSYVSCTHTTLLRSSLLFGHFQHLTWFKPNLHYIFKVPYYHM